MRLIEIRLLEGPNVYRLEPVVKIELTGYHGLLEFPIGLLEAFAMRLGATPKIAVEVYAHDAVSFLVSW